MKIDIKPGVYVVAVSGGVDSMVLLDLLSRQSQESGVMRHELKNSDLKSHISNLRLIVAHFDHGIRPDSERDKLLVQKTAQKYGLPFVFDEGRLGSNASEAKARDARYKFLAKVVKAAGAQAIITAHHQDDLLETAIINMLRGTGRRGLTSLKDLPELKRPLLNYRKAEILDYAKKHNLKWHEDSTNQDTHYLRNYVRHKILPKFSAKQKKSLLGNIDQLVSLNQQIDQAIEPLVREKVLDRGWFIELDHKVARDIMSGWLRAHSINEIDSKRLELLVRAAKTYSPNKRIDINKKAFLSVNKDTLTLSP